MDYTTNSRLKILLVATEIHPYVSVGGVGSVIANLSKALVKLGHDVRVIVPKFGLIDEKSYPMNMEVAGLKVPTQDNHQPELICNVKSIKQEGGVTVYFLENQEYFEKRANVYGYSDDPTRFLLLSRGVLEFIKTKKFVPDIIHCNDWHTGAIPNYIKTIYRNDPVVSAISSVFTIHNLAFQGMFDHKHVSELNYDDGRSRIEPFFSSRLINQNFMRRGILYADIVNTVSKAYSKEILTPEYGEGLDKLLLELKDKLFGIVNGINYKDFNPETDRLIKKRYTMDSLEERRENKIALQKEFGLPQDPDKFVLSFVGRLDYQKGVDLAVDVLKELFKENDVQFVQIGGGDWSLVDKLQELKKLFPQNVGIHPYPNFTLPRLIFSGADVMLCPSRFEPCGITQLESMRYGCVPVVRAVGGLSDTVENVDSAAGTGTGFVFKEFSPYSFYGQLVRAIEAYKNRITWKKIQQNAMRKDFSWEYSAKEYDKLYKKSRLVKNRQLSGNHSFESMSY